MPHSISHSDACLPYSTKSGASPFVCIVSWATKPEKVYRAFIEADALAKWSSCFGDSEISSGKSVANVQNVLLPLIYLAVIVSASRARAP